MKTVVSVCSARPNFVKLAAVHHALAARSSEFKHVIVHTGQHYDPLLSDVFFEQLNIPQPDFNLGIKGSTREEVIDATKSAFLNVLPQIHPDIVLVYGDVNGAVGAALATLETSIKIGHVEAGLRSFDVDMPEEHNRIAIDRIADLLFCSEQSGMNHLDSESITGKSYLVGNTMIDTLMRMMPSIQEKPLSARVSGMDKFVVATLHRPSNVDDRESLIRCLDFLKQINEKIPVVLPAHPRLMNAMQKFAIEQPFVLFGPMEYLSFLKHIQHCTFILTDSGGIQEEATFLKKKCFTLRLNTERPATVDSGSNTLIDLEKEEDRRLVLDFAENPQQPSITVPSIWDGKAGERIVQVLAERL